MRFFMLSAFALALLANTNVSAYKTQNSDVSQYGSSYADVGAEESAIDEHSKKNFKKDLAKDGWAAEKRLEEGDTKFSQKQEWGAEKTGYGKDEGKEPIHDVQKGEFDGGKGQGGYGVEKDFGNEKKVDQAHYPEKSPKFGAVESYEKVHEKKEQHFGGEAAKEYGNSYGPPKGNKGALIETSYGGEGGKVGEKFYDTSKGYREFSEGKIDAEKGGLGGVQQGYGKEALKDHLEKDGKGYGEAGFEKGAKGGFGEGGFEEGGYGKGAKGFEEGGYGKDAKGFGEGAYGKGAKGFEEGGYGKDAKGFGESAYGKGAKGFEEGGYGKGAKGGFEEAGFGKGSKGGYGKEGKGGYEEAGFGKGLKEGYGEEGKGGFREAAFGKGGYGNTGFGKGFEESGYGKGGKESFGEVGYGKGRQGGFEESGFKYKGKGPFDKEGMTGIEGYDGPKGREGLLGFEQGWKGGYGSGVIQEPEFGGALGRFDELPRPFGHTKMTVKTCNKLMDSLLGHLQVGYTKRIAPVVKLPQLPPTPLGGWGRVSFYNGAFQNLKGRICRGGDFKVIPQGEIVLVTGMVSVPEPRIRYQADAFLYSKLKVRNRPLHFCAKNADFRFQMAINKKAGIIQVADLEPIDVQDFHLEDEKGDPKHLVWPFNKIQGHALEDSKITFANQLTGVLCNEFRTMVKKPEVKEEILSQV